jgi:hypothetical protein
VVLDGRGTAFQQVAIVCIDDAVDEAVFRLVDMAAYHAVKSPAAAHGGQ